MENNKTIKATTPSGIRHDAVKAQYNISLALDLRQIRNPGTYELDTFDEKTSTAFHVTLNYSSVPYTAHKRESLEDMQQRIEARKAADKAMRLQKLTKAYEKTAKHGRASLSEMAEIVRVSTKSIRRYVREFSGEYKLKASVVTRRMEVENEHSEY